MTEKNSDVETINKITERVNKTTPGKWKWLRGSVDEGVEGYAWVNEEGHDIFMCGDENKRANAIFVAHARDDVKYLIQGLSTCQAELKEANDKLAIAVTALQWALDYVSDNTDPTDGETPIHDCEFETNPQNGACDFHKKYFSAIQTLAKLKKESV